MKTILLRFKLELFLLSIVTLVILGFVIAVVLTRNPAPSDISQVPESIPPLLLPARTIQESSFSAYFKTEVGKTSEADLRKMPELQEKTSSKAGLNEFTYNSAFADRSNTIFTEDSLVAFKRVIPVNSQTWEAPQMSAYEDIYGIAEAQHTGSTSHGRFAKTSIYATKGVAFIFNPSTGEVYEIQSFSPTTVDQYIAKWGEDIHDYSNDVHEEPEEQAL